MKRQTQICIFVCILLATAIVALLWMNWEKENDPPKGETVSLESEPATVVESHVEVKPYLYILKEKDGEILAYHYKDNTIYMPTGILIRQLPEQIQKQIKKGLYFSDEEELFSFLESYSS